MKVIPSNQIEVTEFSPTEYQAIIHNFTFANPEYASALKFGRHTGNLSRNVTLYSELDDVLTLPIGSLQFLLDTFEPEVIEVGNSHPVQISTTIETRPYQERAIRLALASKGGLIVAPTGAGKTTMGIELAARLGERCLILVKSKDLAHQWQEAIKRFTGLDCGIIGGGKFEEGAEFTVALVQSLIKNPVDLDYGLIIADEAHNTPALQAYTVLNAQAAKYPALG